ncbi:MAG: hypothetical protein H7A23_13620 [Leptospiraceae bacterium]|nr:hypothetical protein [Leptospiraceae bacterium]MCP5495589.1 hypothetical protein [Leptospiraceae bacterium]
MIFKQVISLATVLLFSSFIVIACGGGSKKKADKASDPTPATSAAGADLNKKVLVIGEGGSLSIFDPQNPTSYRGGGSSACCGRRTATPTQENLEPNFIVVPSYDKANSNNCRTSNCYPSRR